MADTFADTFDWVTAKKIEDSQIELSGELPAEEFAVHYARALKKLQETASLPGFRKGHVPEDMLEKTVGQAAVLEEAAELALADLYPRIVIAKKLDAVGRPAIGITKLAKGNPLGFKITTALMPEVELPDYQTIAEKALQSFVHESTDVTNDEFDEFVKSLRMQYAKAEAQDAHDPNTAPDPQAPATETSLPDLNDEFVKKLGTFESVEDFKTKARAHMEEQKKQKLNEKKRVAITDSIIEKTSIALPPVFVESELEKMTAQFKSDIERMGMKLEDYLKAIKKSVDDLRNEWREEAAKRAKLQLVLNAISEKENITVPPEEVKREAEHILEHFKDADRERVHIYAESVLRNEKTLQFLEGQK